VLEREPLPGVVRAALEQDAQAVSLEQGRARVVGGADAQQPEPEALAKEGDGGSELATGEDDGAGPDRGQGWNSMVV